MPGGGSSPTRRTERRAGGMILRTEADASRSHSSGGRSPSTGSQPDWKVSSVQRLGQRVAACSARHLRRSVPGRNQQPRGGCAPVGAGGCRRCRRRLVAYVRSVRTGAGGHGRGCGAGGTRSARHVASAAATSGRLPERWRRMSITISAGSDSKTSSAAAWRWRKDEKDADTRWTIPVCAERKSLNTFPELGVAGVGRKSSATPSCARIEAGANAASKVPACNALNIELAGSFDGRVEIPLQLAFLTRVIRRTGGEEDIVKKLIMIGL